MSAEERERWDARYRERGDQPAGEPSALVTGLDPLLPRAGRALDLGGGDGRHALWLARRGLQVTIADVSPEGLGRARRLAAAAGLALETVELDLDEATSLPPGPWALLLCFHCLWRPLPARAAAALAPGGLLVWVQPTVRNLERHPHPSARFLLAEGEMARLAGDGGLEVVRLEEGWSVEGRHEALLVARRPPQLSR